MNHYHILAERAPAAAGETHFISPRGHYYVAKDGLDTRFVRNSHLIHRYNTAFANGKLTAETLSQLTSLAKRAIGE